MVKPSISHEHLGAVIAELRSELGMTQSELGAHTGLGQAAISRVEGGLRRVDTVELVEIADALGVDVAVVLDNARERASGPAASGVEVLALRLAEEHDGDGVAASLRWVEGFLQKYDRLVDLTGDD